MREAVGAASSRPRLVARPDGAMERGALRDADPCGQSVSAADREGIEVGE